MRAVGRVSYTTNTRTARADKELAEYFLCLRVINQVADALSPRFLDEVMRRLRIHILYVYQNVLICASTLPDRVLFVRWGVP